MKVGPRQEERWYWVWSPGLNSIKSEVEQVAATSLEDAAYRFAKKHPETLSFIREIYVSGDAQAYNVGLVPK